MSIDFVNDIITQEINELSEDPYILNYITKIGLNQNNIKECRICIEDNNNITFLCGHEICVDCYCRLTKCYYNCNT